jgi:hypothetical protein
VAAGKQKMQALVAVMRKLLHAIPRGSPKSGHVGSLQNRPC